MNKYEGFIGKVLDNRYKIIELVGVGGMAFVLKAEDLMMNRIVAIKVLNDQYNGDEQAEQRFINESKAVAMLSNKNIVGIYDVAIYADIKYIVMEYLDGITLRVYEDNKGAIPWREACIYIGQVLRALEHAHSKGVIHRDIKPQNIMLLKSGEIKVTDFGIAKTPNTPQLTLTDKAIGTVYYISPEQASGKETTYASDLYSVGVMLYEAVTGKLPFVAESPVSIAMMQINQQPQDPRELMPDLPAGVAQIILRAMAKQPSERFSDAHAMLKAVEYILKHPEADFNNRSAVDYVDLATVNTGENEAIEPLDIASIAKEPNPKAKGKKENGKKKKSEEKASRSMFPIIAGVFFAFLIIGLGVGGYLLIKWVPGLFSNDSTGHEFNVPSLVNEMYDTELKISLSEQNYEVTVKEGYNPNVDYGVIISQDPEPGIRKEQTASCRLTLTINRSPTQLTVPDVRYQSAAEADKILRQYNLKTTIQEQKNNLFSAGQVIGTNPAAGEKVIAGDTVTLYICAETEITIAEPVPDVLGKTEEEASQLLQQAYLMALVKREENTQPTGTVIAQSIEAGTENLDAWTTVTITVSIQSDKTPVPDVVGDMLALAERKLNNAGFQLKVIYDEDSPLVEGTVVHQNPVSGTKAEKNAVVTLTVAGSSRVKADMMPYVIGLTEEAAKSAVEDARYTCVVVYEESNDSAPGLVIKQSIEPYTTGLAADTEVTLTVAKEPVNKTVDVPLLTDLTLEAARTLLEGKGLVLGDVSEDPTSILAPGHIVGQSIAADTAVEPGTVIDVVVSPE